MYNIVSPDENIIKRIAFFANDETDFCEYKNTRNLFQRIAENDIPMADFYKQSEYNYCEKSAKRCLIYNPLYNTMVSLAPEEYQQYIGKIGVDEAEESFFVQNGLWVEDSLDEKKGYSRMAKMMHIYSSPEPTLILATTQKCNAHCAYCYEKGVEHKDFPADKIDKLVQFISHLDWHKAVHITWFGGEPLMNVPFIDEVAQKLGEAGVPFYSSMISNASLVTEKLVQEHFAMWRMKHIQITLDGTKDEYERIKAYSDKENGKFENIIDNIGLIARYGTSVDIRVNIDSNNIADTVKLFHQMEDIFLNNDKVRYYPAFINGSACDVPVEMRVDVLYDILKQMQNPAKIMSVNRLYNPPLNASCHRAQPNAFAIDADGNIYKCEHDIGRCNNRLGDVEQGLYGEDSRKNPPRLRKECEDCVFSPKCYGGCESNYLKSADPCMVDRYIIPAYMRVILDK